MAYSNILSLSRQIDGLYAACLRTAFAEALTVKYGAGAFAEFQRIDRENTAAQAAAGSSVVNVLQGKRCFEDMDVQACSKALLYLEQAREPVFDRFDVTKTNPRVFQAVRPVLFQLIDARNYKAHTEGELDHDRLKLCAKQETVVIEQLFPRRVDPIDAEGRTYLARMELLLVQMMGEISVKRYRAEDYLDPRRFDLSVFHDVCASLRIRSVTESGEKYFYSSDLDSDLELLKNQLPRPKTPSAFAAAAGLGKTQQQDPRQKQQPSGQQAGDYPPAQAPTQPYVPPVSEPPAPRTPVQYAPPVAAQQTPPAAPPAYRPESAPAFPVSAPARQSGEGEGDRSHFGQLLAVILLALLVAALALVLILVLKNGSAEKSGDSSLSAVTAASSGNTAPTADDPAPVPTPYVAYGTRPICMRRTRTTSGTS